MPPAAVRSPRPRAVARSPEVAARLATMRESVLPYGAAFERQALPAVPAELARRIGDLARVSGAARGHQRRRLIPLWLAVAFAAGVLVCWAALKLKSLR